MVRSTEGEAQLSAEARADLVAAIAAKHMRHAVASGAIALPGTGTGVIPLYRAPTPAPAGIPQED